MVTLAAVGQAAVIKSIGVCGIDLDRFGVIGNRMVVIATAGVSIAAMHVSRGVTRIGSDRLAVILHGLVEIALALPLIGAVAVDEREIALVKPAGLKEARAGLDGSVAGPPHAKLAVIRRRGNNKPGASHADQAGDSPFLNVFCVQHQTPQLFGHGLFNCSRRFLLQLRLCRYMLVIIIA